MSRGKLPEWMIRHEKLKEEMALKAREEAKRRRRKVDQACFEVNDGAPCRYLKWDFNGCVLRAKKTCTIKRCPKDTKGTK